MQIFIMVLMPFLSPQPKPGPNLTARHMYAGSRSNGEDLVKTFASDSNSQHHLLIVFGASPTAIHHLHEVGIAGLDVTDFHMITCMSCSVAVYVQCHVHCTCI